MMTIEEYVELMNANISEELATGLIAMCSVEFLLRTNLNVVPPGAYGLVARMVIEKNNRLGTEGLSSHNLGAASESFEQDYSEDLKAGIYGFRKVRYV